MFVFEEFFNALAMLIRMLANIMIFLIIGRAIISWVSPDPYNPIVRFLCNVTEPILQPLRRILPPLGGLDLSPIAAFFAIYFVSNVLVRLCYQIAYAAGG